MKNLIACYNERKKLVNKFGNGSVWYTQLIELGKEIALYVSTRKNSNKAYSDYATNAKQGFLYRGIIITAITQTKCFMVFAGIDEKGNEQIVKAKKTTSICYK